MTKHKIEEKFLYDPDNLLNTLIKTLNLKNDAGLSRALEVAPPYISKIRTRRTTIGAAILIRMNEISNISIKDLRELMGDRREHFRASDNLGSITESANDE